MNNANNLIAPHLQMFFAEHLTHHKQASPQTIATYRDTFRLFLNFLRDTTRTEPSALRLEDLDAPAVLAFLQHLQQQRHNSVRSRNNRLSAIRSFFRWVALRDPESIGIVTRVLAIPKKREDKRLITYLTREEIEAVIAAPDSSHWLGQRDHALLLTLYNSGARVSELIGLEREQVHFGTQSYLQLTGKGRKERTIPLWSHTAQTIKAWFGKLSDTNNQIAFPNARGERLSRHGVNYILQQAVQRAQALCPSLGNKKITPHLIRHYVFFLIMSRITDTVAFFWYFLEANAT